MWFRVGGQEQLELVLPLSRLPGLLFPNAVVRDSSEQTCCCPPVENLSFQLC